MFPGNGVYAKVNERTKQRREVAVEKILGKL